MNESEWSSDERRALYHLEMWAKLMELGEQPKLGYPSTTSGFDCAAFASKDIEDMGSLEDWKAAHTCDTVIKDLPEIERCAIYHRYKIAVFRFPREPYELILSRAIVNVGKGLFARGVVHP